MFTVFTLFSDNLLLVKLFSTFVGLVLNVDVDKLVENVLFFEYFIFSNNDLIGLFEILDALFHVSSAY